MNMKITAKVHLAKFAEGVDPAVGEPYEIIEKEIVLTGDAAAPFLKDIGGSTNVTN